MWLVLENGRLSDRYCIGTDTGYIVSNRIGYCCIGRYTRINAGSSTVDGDRITHDDQRAFKRPVTRFMVHGTGEGWMEGSGRRL